MKRLIAATLALAGTAALADPNESAVQRALLKRDQQSAEFNAQLRGQSLDALHSRQLQQMENSTAPRIERSLMTRERDAQSLRATPTAPRSPERPLPLPGGLPHVVDPVPVQSGGG